MSTIGKKIGITVGSALIGVAGAVAVSTPAQAVFNPAPSCIHADTSTVPRYVYIYDGCGPTGGGNSDEIRFKILCLPAHPVETTIIRGRSIVWGTGNLTTTCGVKVWLWK